ncbi:mono/diheme cytochrome c family protein [Povalibacter uvarum]|uniref:Mono/diheme cytochrome c family protein n=1 Tax=Povalibacter uvarum TaxID=732238 RepID=A0A841HLA2_9GAMM|nr:LamG domain-containing protein [Povalibacter uvarum]MBB6093646.1 mono/diheme cytochrome c family protein [Povalibacter uvarum]
MKRVFNTGLVRFAAIALLGAFALGGCSSGADTEQNPVTDGPGSGPNYNGPPPATDDIQAFRIEFWENIRGTNRCGNCHTANGQAPSFARSDDVNAAYQAAQAIVDRTTPSQSPLVLKVAGGHNCWLADAGSCATILTRWITDWVGATEGGGKQIELVPPTPKDPGSSRRFPANAADAGFGPLHAVLVQHCGNCHTSESATKQQPYFASSNIEEAYIAAMPKINLDRPADSRFVIRLGRESHNCWASGGSCQDNANTVQALIQQMANAVQPAPIDPNLILSKALTLYEGTIAAGGNRYDNNVIAMYEFKTGSGSTVFDTSGVDPAADLTLAGTRGTDFDWVGGWGVVFKSPMAKAQASTTTSRKFHQLINATGEYSIEAWVIPGNVTQEDARIVTYSGSTTSRNFTMGQTLYNYDFYARSTATGANGTPQLSTDDADERLQAALQHVVLTFDPVAGRKIYVNGVFTGDNDGAGGGTLGDWDNSFAFALGNEVSNNRPWAGVLRLVAVHNRVLTPAQITQNFEAGVGEKYFLLFGIEHITNIPRSYILFEAAQYDSFGYLFTNPKFISLDANARPGGLVVKGMRIGVNAAEPHAGQAYRLLDTTVPDAGYDPAAGHTLSAVGTIIGLERGPAQDEFYLCFDQLGSRQNVCSNFAEAVPPTLVNSDRPSDIGVRTFDGINATMAAMTGVDPNTASVKAAFDSVRQSLPAVVDINAFLSSHQTSIAQLAITYCSALVDNTSARSAYFPGLNWSADISGQRSLLINPLVTRVVGNAATQPNADTATELDALVTKLCTSGSCGSNASTRTPTVAKAVCGAAVGNAAMLVR